MHRSLSRITFALVTLFTVLMTSRPSIAVVMTNQNFDTWSSSQFVTTNRDGWSGVNVRPATGGFKPPASTPIALWFNSIASGTNATFMTPFLTDGIGQLTVAHFRYLTSGSNVCAIETSTNGVDGWVRWYTLTNNPATAIWTTNTYTFNTYTQSYLRFMKIADDGAANAYLGLDNIVISYPPAKMTITNVTLNPSPVYAEQPEDVSATLLLFGNVTNIIASNFWIAANVTNAIQMSNTSGNVWTTMSSIPGRPAGNTVSYFVKAWFEGPDAITPATSFTSQFTTVVRPFMTGLSSLTVTGGFQTNMFMIGDYLWQGVPYTNQDLISPTIGFMAVTTNTPPITNAFGDNNQVDFELQINETAETNGAGISVVTTNSGQFLVYFNESNLSYSVNHGYHQDFESWSGGPLTNTDWFATNGTIASDSTRSWRGNYMQLVSNRQAYIQTPYLAQGIGELAFWYRNYETSSTPPAVNCRIQKSMTGGTNANEWITITNLVIPNTAYNRFVRTIEDRNSHYVRLVNTPTNNRIICLDDVQVADPYYAGVVFSNLTHAPTSPTATNPVTVTIDILPRGGASNLNATLWFRSGTNGSFTNTFMTNTFGTTFSNATPIPLYFGPTGGAGTVQYYVGCDFTGFQSAVTSPTYFNPEGSNAPVIKSYVIQSAYVTMTNPAISPDPPNLSTNIQVSIDIIPYAAASNITATLYYRFGGGTTITNNQAMSPIGNDRYRATVSIPTNVIPGTPFYYSMRASFVGPSAIQPTNYPTAGTTTPLIAYIDARPLTSVYTNMEVTGNITGALFRITNNMWSGVATIGTLTNPLFRLNGIIPGVSNYFGDSTQQVFTLPVHGVADDLNGSNIVVFGTNSGHYLVQYNETNHIYSVRGCAYLNFDEMAGTETFDNWTNYEGWGITNGRTTTDISPDMERAFIGKSGILNTNLASYIISPFMPNGVGEIGFWCRNAETSGLAHAGFTIEVAPAITGTWVSIATVTNILTQKYYNNQFFLSDRVSRYVRFSALTNALRPGLCLDEIVIADPAAGVVFTNMSTVPANPTILNSVTATVHITAMGGATNLNAQMFFRIGTNGGFETLAMNNVASNRYVAPPIVNAPAGTIQYYVECTYDGFQADKTSPLTHLPGSSNNANPLVITVADLIRTQAFDTAEWGNSPGYVNTNNAINGWTGSSVRIAQAGYSSVASTPRACWLNDMSSLETGTITSLCSPLLSNGVGTIYFALKNRLASGWNTMDVEVSNNSTNWTTYGTYTMLNNNTIWVTNKCLILRYDPVYIRFKKTDESSDSDNFLGIDNIAISYPPAMTTISNVMTHPGYPSTNADGGVFVSCTLGNENPVFPAYDNIVQVYWRRVGGPTAYNGPIPMSRNNGYFRTLYGISNQVRDTAIQYFITNDFKGYYFEGFLGTNENRTPNFYPGGVAVPTNYLVRPFKSNYNSLDFVINNDTIRMRQLQHNIWQGILNLTAPTNILDFRLVGYSNYNGIAYSTSNTVFGDSGAWKPNLPLSNFAATNGSNLTAHGEFIGQYVLRFDETTGEYLLQNCVWQDFETWPITADFRSSGNDNSPIVGQFFADFPTNATDNSGDNFSAATWDVVNIFTNFSDANNSTYWNLVWGRIAADWVVTRGGAGLSKGDKGFVFRAWNSTPGYDGIGTVSFRYSGGISNLPCQVALYLCKTNDNDDIFIPSRWEGPYFVSSNLTNTVRWYSSTNIINTYTTMTVIIAQESGDTNCYIDDVSVSEWYADTKTIGGWTAAESWITTNNANSGNCCEFDPTRADGPMYIRSPELTNGVSFFSFYYSTRTDTNPAILDIQISNDEIEWTTFDTISNATTTYVPYQYTVMTNQSVYLQISNRSPKNSIVYIDDISCSTITASNSWLIHNALVTNDSTRAWYGRSAFLNKDASTYPVGPNNFSGVHPYLLSPYLTNGIGEISFWYKHYGPSVTTNSLLRIQKSLTGFTNASDWIDLIVPLSVNDAADYSYYQTSFYDTAYHYVRIVNETNPPGARVCLDDVLITGPIASDLILTNLGINPIQPLYSNKVQVVVDVTDKFLNPSNIVLEAVYATATNYGGDGWDTLNILPMTLVSSNLSERRFTYATPADYLIPTNAIDTWVKYYVRCTFDGRHTINGTSPKTNRTFTTPSWYYPVDFGTTMPYYVTFNCPTGLVFFNEINTIDPDGYGWYVWTNEFIEICGPGGVDIRNWKIEVLDNGFVQYASYAITNHPVFLNQTNGHGFWVIGDVGVPNVEQVLDSPVGYWDANEHLPSFGGLLRLVRSMGAYEQRIGYTDAYQDPPYEEIGQDYGGSAGSLQKTGSGTNYHDFSWSFQSSYSPGVVNDGQNLFGYGSGEEYLDPPASVIIEFMRLLTNSVTIRCTGVTNWYPTPWYSTNLLLTNRWTNLASYQRTTLTNNVIYLNFTVPTNPPVFFKIITSTNY